METYRIEMTLSEDGTLTLKNLPFRAGERVAVAIAPTGRPALSSPDPLRGTILYYENPTEPVAENDWEAAR
jgi:hypothetical protein